MRVPLPCIHVTIRSRVTQRGKSLLKRCLSLIPLVTSQVLFTLSSKPLRIFCAHATHDISLWQVRVGCCHSICTSGVDQACRLEMERGTHGYGRKSLDRIMCWPPETCTHIPCSLCVHASLTYIISGRWILIVSRVYSMPFPMTSCSITNSCGTGKWFHQVV